MKALPLVAMLALAACGSDPEPSTTGTSSSGASSSGGSSASGGTGGACQPVTLAPPAAGQVDIQATFSDPQGGYNGSTEPFDADAASSTVYYSGAKNPYLWTALVKPQGTGDDGQRGIVIGIPSDAPLCTSHVTTNNVLALPYFRYFEGSNTARQWACAGNVVLDTLVDKAQTFHFAVTCEPMTAPNSGAGTVKVAGQGAATLK